MPVTAAQTTKWQKMSTPSLRGVVNKQFPDNFNGCLIVAKKDEMMELLSEKLTPGSLASRLKMRMSRRRSNGGAKFGRPSHKLAARAGGMAIMRKAASPIPPTSAFGQQQASLSVAGTLKLAAALADYSEVQNASPDELRRAMDAMLTIRG